jgi:hypothetical protein
LGGLTAEDAEAAEYKVGISLCALGAFCGEMRDSTASVEVKNNE